MYKYIILIFLFSCSLVEQNENKDDQIIARVGDKFLLRDEILYQESMGDSVSVFSNQINDWLKKQLLLKSAYQSDELRLLIDRKVEKYRDDLLLFEFEKLMLMSNPSQEVSLVELENYYDENIEDFILPFNLVQALYAKISLQAPGLNTFISDFRRYPNTATDKVLSYIYQFSEKSFIEDSIWVKFDDIVIGTPFPNNIDKNNFLKTRTFYQMRDEEYVYLIKILDKRLKGDFSPLNFEVDVINTIILNKRKQDLFDKLRDSIFINSTKGVDYEIF